MSRFVLYCILLQSLIGCRHHYRIETYPPGASVYLDGEEIGSTPLEQKTIWYPFKKIPLKVSLPNYRTIHISADEQINLRIVLKEMFTFRYKKLMGIEPRTTHQILLVRKHGPAGTWTPDDAQKNK